MIFFCKISPFFFQHHPDRLSQCFARHKALWVAPSANTKKITYFTTKKIIGRFLWFEILRVFVQKNLTLLKYYTYDKGFVI